MTRIAEKYCNSSFDPDEMENVFIIKDEYLSDIIPFDGFSTLAAYSQRIDVCNDDDDDDDQ